MKKAFLGGLLLALVVGAFFVGRLTAPQEEAELSVYDCTTFYATIESIDGNLLLVQGLDVNDINTRSRFTLTVDAQTRLLWHGTEMKLTDLQVGNTVAVTYTGLIQEIYPGNIVEPAVQIVLLDDTH